MKSVRPCLVYVDRAEEAINRYVSLIKNSKILELARSDGSGPFEKGKLMSATFTLDGREYTAFDGGSSFSFAEGMSLMVICDDQAEIDNLWTRLTENGGEPGRCGWLKDPFGMSWQIIPANLGQMLSDSAHGDTAKATEAMMKMSKLDVATLERAYRRSA